MCYSPNAEGISLLVCHLFKERIQDFGKERGGKLFIILYKTDTNSNLYHCSTCSILKLSKT